MDKKITFISAAGDTLEAYTGGDYWLSDLTGVESTTQTIMTARGFQQHGSNYLGTLLESRMISFKLTMMDRSTAGLKAKRAHLLKVFNPVAGAGELILDMAGDEYRIIASVYDGPHEVPAESIDVPDYVQSFTVGLFCPRPAWESKTRYALKMVGFIGGFRFPFHFPFRLAEQGDAIEIDYPGTIDAPVLIEFIGPAVMPKITKRQTGENIEVDLDLQEGDKLYIDTTPGAINIYKTTCAGEQQSAFNFVNPLNSYFQLTHGINTLSFSAASGNPEVYIYYRDRYSGV